MEEYNPNMPTETLNEGAPVQTPSVPGKRTYSVRETVFAALTVVSGYLFLRMWPASANPFGALLFTVFLFSFGAVWLKMSGGRQNPLSVVCAVSAVLFSAGFFITGNGVLHICIMLWVIAAYVYWIYLSSGNAIDGLGDVTWADFIKAFFVMPWLTPSALYRALFSKKDREASGRKTGMAVLWIFLGLMVALLPTLIVTKVLMYDDSFRKMVEQIGKFDISEPLSHLWSLVLAVPLAGYAFSGMISCSDRKYGDRFTAGQVRGATARARVFPQLMCVFSVAPLLCVYLLFFISQSGYYLSAFTGTLPSGLGSYSEYARSGFFELCGVSAFNAVVLFLVSALMRRKDDGKPGIAQRILSGLLSLFTVILITTAVAKMLLYIGQLGLTRKRVYTTWFMVLLGVCFIFVIVKQIKLNFNSAACMLFAFIILFSVLVLSGVDGIIAGYNADRYIDGSLDYFDAPAMGELGDAAVPSLIKVAEHLESIGIEAGQYDLDSILSGEQGGFAVVNRGSDVIKREALEFTKRAAAASGLTFGDETEKQCRVYSETLAALGRYTAQKDKGGFFSLTMPRILAESAVADATDGR